jgi:pSer/pThr/pTyr-binding forkhead associated (FHA) protein
MNNAYQLVMESGDSRGGVFLIEQGTNLIGRWAPTCRSFPEIDLESSDPEVKVSRKHAMITLDADGLHIQDLGSLNGTYVNQNLLHPEESYEIGVGDLITIGPILFRVEESVNQSVAPKAQELSL